MPTKEHWFLRSCLRLIAAAGLLLPRQHRAQWQREWDAELRARWQRLLEWRKLNGRTQMNLLRQTSGAFSDATWLRRQLKITSDFWLDVRYGLRMMRKNPGFTLVAVLTLALGIGANTAIFSVVNAVLLRPLPFREGERLVRLYQVPKGGTQRISIRAPIFLALKEQGQFFEDIVGQRYMGLTLSTPEGPEQIVGLGVTEGWLRTLGLEPILGRGFLPEEERAGGESQAILVSHGFWQRRFGLQPNILGQTLTVNSQTYTVVGVLPAGFNYPYDNDLWTPMDVERAWTGVPWAMNVQARLKPGTSVEEAQAELDIIAQRLARQFPATSQGMNLLAVPTRQVMLGDNSNVVLALFAAVGFVLLIACANVANLLLARSVVRQKELAIRAALGASRLRQVRQLLTESVLLASIGGIIGLGLAVWGSESLMVLVPGRMVNIMDNVPIDFSVLGFTTLIALTTGVVFGLTPALRTSRPDVQALLKEGGRSSKASGSHRLLGGLVVAEIGLALVLLAGAGLMMRNFQRLYQADLGYSAEGLVTLRVSLAGANYGSPQARINFVRQVGEQLEAVPGIQVAGATCMFPLPPANFLASLAIEGHPRTPDQQLIVNHRLVNPEFFRALGIPLLRGRVFTEADNANSQPVAIISEAMARRYWPGDDPLGQRVRNARQGESAPWLTVVGIVGDVREPGEIADTWYLPYPQHAETRQATRMIFAVRTAVDSDDLSQGLREAVWAIDTAMAVQEISTVRDQYAETLSQQRLGSIVLGMFAAFGLLMAALGIYGVMSYAVSQRTHEIGVRMALGAQPGQILRWILRQGTLLVLSGVALGLGGALALTRFMSSLLSEVEPTDPATLVVVSLLLAAAALLACYLPARRATRVDPIVALRYE